MQIRQKGFVRSLVKRVGTVAYISNGVEHASAVQYGITDCDRDTRNHVPDKKSGRADRRDGPLWRDFTVLLLFKGSIGEVNCLKREKIARPTRTRKRDLACHG